MTTFHDTIAIEHVERLLRGARSRGRDAAAVLRRAGISPALLDAPRARVSQPQFCRLIRTLGRVMRDETWGLASRPVKVGTFAQCCRALAHCDTLRTALQEGFRHYRLVLDDVVPRLRIEGDTAHVLLVSRPGSSPDARMLERTFMFFTVGVASWLTGRRLPLLGLDYSPRDRNEHSDAKRIFRAPVAYRPGPVGFRFPASCLDLPVVQTRHSVAEFVRCAPAGLLVRYRDDASVAERVRRILRRRLDHEPPSFERMCDALAMAPQTLRRRLRSEGTGYQTIKDDLRRDAAIAYLARPDLTLMDIAARLGFSDPSTFHRAFKRWTGVAPGEYRSTRLQADEAPGQARSAAARRYFSPSRSGAAGH